MIVFADSHVGTTIFYIFLWFVFFPGLVMGMIAYAIAVARGEKLENDERRRYRRE